MLYAERMLSFLRASNLGMCWAEGACATSHAHPHTPLKSLHGLQAGDNQHKLPRLAVQGIKGVPVAPLGKDSRKPDAGFAQT